MTIDRRLFLVSSAAAASLSLTGIRRANAVPVAVVAAAWVGQKLLEGALQYEGGQIMSRALGDPVLSDVRSWIAAAVAEIKAFIQAALTQVVINDMQAELDAVNTAIYEYASLKPQNQKENRFLL